MGEGGGNPCNSDEVRLEMVSDTARRKFNLIFFQFLVKRNQS